MYIRLKAMFRVASYGGQFALLVARHLYFLLFVIIVLLHLANKICSVDTLLAVLHHSSEVAACVLIVILSC